jgi:hypothetical protein
LAVYFILKVTVRGPGVVAPCPSPQLCRRHSQEDCDLRLAPGKTTRFYLKNN